VGALGGGRRPARRSSTSPTSSPAATTAGIGRGGAVLSTDSTHTNRDGAELTAGQVIIGAIQLPRYLPFLINRSKRGCREAA
jgi:hypothetical protein